MVALTLPELGGLLADAQECAVEGRDQDGEKEQDGDDHEGRHGDQSYPVTFKF